MRVKICCIASEAEAELALDAGADALGLVSAMPSGPGVIDDGAIARIARYVGDRADTFLLTSRRDAHDIAAQHARARTSTIQLVDALLPGHDAVLRRLLPSVRLVQVLHVTDGHVVTQARAAAAWADMLLLDSGNPTLKELGGTGRVHDWGLSRSVREAVSCPVFLAGGLRSANVAEAVRAVRPHGVDVCSGVREQGALSEPAVRAFIAAARAASGEG